jgi:integrase/recombinase XerD
MPTETTATASVYRGTLADQFIAHGKYLRGWSPRTITIYERALRAFGDTQLTRHALAAWVVALRERGHTIGGVNVLTRAICSYLSWLYEEGHTSEHLRIKQLPNPPRAIKVLSDAEVQRIVRFRPTRKAQTRTWTLIVLLLDTGLRIDEALGLQRRHVDLDALMVRVLGKGHRERLVPISTECRKHLHRLMTRTNNDYVFGTRTITRMTYRNAYRDIKDVCAHVRVTGAHVRPHAFRHLFASSYVRRGGDIYRLCRILGHSSITTTTLYLRSMGIEHLQEGHEHLTPLRPASPMNGHGAHL